MNKRNDKIIQTNIDQRKSKLDAVRINLINILNNVPVIYIDGYYKRNIKYFNIMGIHSPVYLVESLRAIPKSNLSFRYFPKVYLTSGISTRKTLNQCLKQYIEANPSKSEQSIKHYFIEKCYINEATLNKAYEKLQKWNREKVIIRQPENNKKSKRFHQFNSEKGTGNDNNKVFIEQKYVVFAYDVTNNKDMQITISNSRSVLKFDGKTLIDTTVQDLVKGDLFFDYSNENKESLYELINNNSVILKKIELSSKRWKQILHRIMYGYDYELEKRILQELRVKKNYIIRTWLDKKSRIKFPSQPRFKKLVKIYCDFNLLINTEANELISYQNQYVSMMNSIGRHFSNEIHDILKNNGKNHLTYYIKEFVVEYKKEYPVMAQFSSKEALKIIETNSPELRFIRKIEIV